MKVMARQSGLRLLQQAAHRQVPTTTSPGRKASSAVTGEYVLPSATTTSCASAIIASASRTTRVKLRTAPSKSSTWSFISMRRSVPLYPAFSTPSTMFCMSVSKEKESSKDDRLLLIVWTASRAESRDSSRESRSAWVMLGRVLSEGRLAEMSTPPVLLGLLRLASSSFMRLMVSFMESSESSMSSMYPGIWTEMFRTSVV
mmetsp:Transcript_8595/g.13197  ORF Transcript_8595/g.13197 Transcript_8595/m.13197 type:complete len:201 (+) Transcript_8595:454-1056(+)